MASLEEQITATYLNTTETERVAKEIEAKIAQVPELRADLDIPPIQYGTKFDASKLTRRAKYFIEKYDAPLASFLGISTGLHQQLQQEQEAKDALMERMRLKTESLKAANEESANLRRYRALRGLNVSTGRPQI